ncbi:hypothetical protein TNCV_1633451 [Trichonephila clavipes]|nr:hypothetical protein TNCV_1633451 [Trichonephila clavipes]
MVLSRIDISRMAGKVAKMTNVLNIRRHPAPLEIIEKVSASVRKSSLQTKATLKKKATVVQYPPYSPDIAPCCFRLFPALINTFRFVDSSLQMKLRLN